jgi:elongation factor Ts
MAMAEITAALVKELREKTGAGMMDCKKALGETSGDMESAVDWLRKKGLASAAKKAGRVASEGLVGVAVSGDVAAVIELNSETDFVARNAEFQSLTKEIAVLGTTAGGDLEALKAKTVADGKTAAEAVAALVGKIGENMTLRRYASLSVSQGALASYVHSAVAPGLGKIGVLVALESAGDKTKLAELGRQIAMHVAAASPGWLKREEVDTTALDRERAVLADQARASGKPESVVEKMVEGRLRKFYEENVLIEQKWVMDPEKTVSKILQEAATDVGAPVSLTGFVRFALGEGVEKQSTDFAAEVAAARGG